jgi:DNA-binding XRE family transcriptional regulator
MAKTIYRAEYRLLVDALRERREALGISQSSLAKALGWTQQKVSFIETAARRMDVLEYIAVSSALGWRPMVAMRRAQLALASKPGRR